MLKPLPCSSRTPDRPVSGDMAFRCLMAAFLAAALASAGCGGGGSTVSGAGWDTGLSIDEKVSLIQKLGREGTPNAIERLVEATKDPAEEARIEAIVNLGKTTRKEALPTLEELGRSELRPVRQTVALALSDIKDPGSVRILGGLAADPEYAVRSQVIGSLAQLDLREGVPILVDRALKETEEPLRDAAVGVLSDWKEKSAVPVLESALRSETDEIRGHAAAALGEIGDPSCLPALVGALQDPNPVVRGSAVLSMARLGDPASLPTARAAAEKETDPLARATMAWGICLLDAAGADRKWAIGELERILLDVSTADFARAQSAKALGELKACGSKATLTRAMNDRKGIVKKAVNKALEGMKC